MIEASSPLAAMQPPSFMGRCGGGFRADAPPLYASLAAAKGFGVNSFNFRDLSMKRPTHKSHPDYFNMKPVRGSSPTASLAADLSQNFHIDQRYVDHLAWALLHKVRTCTDTSIVHSSPRLGGRSLRAIWITNHILPPLLFRHPRLAGTTAWIWTFLPYHTRSLSPRLNFNCSRPHRN